MKAFYISKSRFGRLFIFVTIILLMQGCIVSGFKVDQTDTSYKPDSSLITGSVPVTPQQTDDPIIKSDQIVIRDKLISLNAKKVLVSEIKWDNTVTGSEGLISSVAETKKGGHVCRNFTTTRSAFDGVSLYHGQICQVTPEVWNVTSFEAVK